MDSVILVNDYSEIMGGDIVATLLVQKDILEDEEKLAELESQLNICNCEGSVIKSLNWNLPNNYVLCIHILSWG